MLSLLLSRHHAGSDSTDSQPLGRIKLINTNMQFWIPLRKRAKGLDEQYKHGLGPKVDRDEGDGMGSRGQLRTFGRSDLKKKLAK